MKMKNKFLIAVGLLAWGPLASTYGIDLSSRTPMGLLEAALVSPTIAYEGRLRVTHEAGPQPHSQDVRVWFKPPAFYRWEFLTPEGKVSRVCVSNGRNEHWNIVEKKMWLKGRAPKSTKPHVNRQEMHLLEKNYDIVLTGQDFLVGRPVYVMDIVPKTPGKPHQRFWVDAESGIIVGSRRFQPKGTGAVESRFVQFRPGINNMPNQLFDESINGIPAAIEHGYDPDFLSNDEFKNKGGHPMSRPAALPAGFEIESADTFISDGSSIDHYRYSDGLVTVSLFKTDKPARYSHRNPNTLSASPESFSGFLFTNTTAPVYQQKVKGGYVILIGDLSPRDLHQMLNSLK